MSLNPPCRVELRWVDIRGNVIAEWERDVPLGAAGSPAVVGSPYGSAKKGHGHPDRETAMLR